MKSKSKLDKFRFKQTPFEGKKVALYIRVSSEEFTRIADGSKERRASIQAQIQDAKAFAEKHGWEYKVYDADCNISGTEDDVTRPAIAELIADIRAGLIHTVVFRDLARFCRNEYLWHWFIYEIFFKYGVDVKGLNEDINIKTPDGRMIAGLKANIAQNYTLEQAEKSMRSKRLRAEQGSLRTTPCYGYGIKEIDGVRTGYVKESEAEIIKNIFDRFAKGEGSQIVMNDLIAQRILTKKKGKLHTANVLRWIRNPVYKGVIIYNGNKYPSPYPALVDDATWSKANSMIDARASKLTGRKVASNSHLLTGLLKCGYCHESKAKKMDTPYPIYENFCTAFNKSWAGSGKTKRRIKYPIYRCQTKYKHHAVTCPNSPSLKAEMIEGFIRFLVEDIVKADIAKTLNDGERVKELTSKIDATETRISSVTHQSNKIKSLFASGDLDTGEFVDINTRNKESLRALQSELARMREQLASLKADKIKDALATLTNWDHLSAEQKKNGLHKIFDGIYVFRDSIHIYLTIFPQKEYPSIYICYPLQYAKQQGYVVKTPADLEYDMWSLRRIFIGGEFAIPIEWDNDA